MKSILIRCDANELNGYGHLSRCLNIARGIKEKHPDFNVTFIGNYSVKAVSLIDKYHFKSILFPSHNPENARELIPFLNGANILILDSYKITQNYIDNLSKGSFKFCLIADESTVLNCSKLDLVINYAINGTDFDYKSSRQALGLRYFPVKPELKKIRERNLIEKRINDDRILLMIGGHDIYSAGVKILKIIDELVSDKRITFISSSSLSGEYIAKRNELSILPFVEKIEDIYLDTDLSITGGGLSKYESGYCCIRNACVPQNINEFNDSLHFETKRLTKIIGIAYDFNEQIVVANLANLFASKNEPGVDLFHTDSLNNLVDIILN